MVTRSAVVKIWRWRPIMQVSKVRLVEKAPGETGKICVFATTSGDHFGVVRPALGRDQEAALIDVLREILRDEGEP